MVKAIMHLQHSIKIFGMGLAMKIMTLPKPFIYVGADSSLSLCRVIAGQGIKRLMLVTDGPLLKLGVLDAILETLKSAGVTVEVFDKIEPDPDFDVVMKGVKRYRDSQSEAVLAVGGGSSIDGAKAIVACHANDCEPAALVGLFRVKKINVPFFAVPTTAGTGSEVTIAAIVSDKKTKTKVAIADGKLMPSMVALDAKLMLGLPPAITAATGMDALTHAVEAYISPIASAETDSLARAAVRSIFASLVKAYTNGKDFAAREDMAIASCQAGLAFTRAGVGYVHAIAHQFGALYHVPHGQANAIVMPYILDFSKDKCEYRLADLARVTGLGGAGDSDMMLADRFVAAIREMNAQMQIPTVVGSLTRADIPEIARRAVDEGSSTPYPVPKFLDRRQCEAILEKMLPVV